MAAPIVVNLDHLAALRQALNEAELEESCPAHHATTVGAQREALCCAVRSVLRTFEAGERAVIERFLDDVVEKHRLSADYSTGL